LSGEPEVKFRGIVLLSDEGHSVQLCCELLNVSPSGFYDWKSRLPSKRQRENELLKSEIKEIHKESKGTYGSPRIKAALEDKGHHIGKDKVAKLMKEENIRARQKRAFVPKTTVNNPSDKKSDRLFKIEETEVVKPNQVWASDLTYIPTEEGFLYLVVVLDLFNRQVKGWDLSDSMEAKQTVKAFMNAVRNFPGRAKDVIFHSDQGVQNCANDLRNKLELLGFEQSMSRKGNCYDNAFVESFFHSLKNELEEKVFKTQEQAKKAIFEYIETWYNNKRLHSSLGYMSPIEYEKQFGDVA
jgi:transposase InsO family protein